MCKIQYISKIIQTIFSKYVFCGEVGEREGVGFGNDINFLFIKNLSFILNTKESRPKQLNMNI